MAHKVKILMGSDSDWEHLSEAQGILEGFGIEADPEVASAHRSPERVREICRHLERDGFGVIICGAGVAAHLAGVVASMTDIPVIGVPMATPPLDGLDALLSTVQMPPGVPVATMAIGKAGARNAGIMAVKILALSDEDLKEKLREFRKGLAVKVEEMNTKLQRARKGK